MKTTRQDGFTLVEILIAVVIVSILASMAIPAYQSYMLRAHRTDAKTAMMRIMAEQEKFYIQNNRYSTDFGDLGFPSTKTERGWYQLAVTPDNAGNPQTYTLTATAIATEGQTRDKKCRVFRLDNNGRLTADTDGGADNSDECW